jgi:hypothetical protein
MEVGDAIGEVALAVADGNHNGYAHTWALTNAWLVILPNYHGLSPEAIPVGEISGVRTTAGASGNGIVIRFQSRWYDLNGSGARARVRAGAETKDGIAAFAALLCEKAGQTIDPGRLIFTDTGHLTLTASNIMITGDYLGGFPEQPRQRVVTLVFDETGIHVLESAYWCPLTLPWAEVSEVAVEGAEETRRRVTATRMLAVGLFALAFPKDEKRNYAYITATTGQGEFILRTAMTPHEARAKLGQYLRRPADTKSDETPGSGADADELVAALGRVAELHAAGALTDEEFTAAKRRILGIDG